MMRVRTWLIAALALAIAGLVAACGAAAPAATQPPTKQSTAPPTAAPTQPSTSPAGEGTAEAVTQAATPGASQPVTEAAQTPQAGEAALPPGIEEKGQDVVITSGGKDYKTYFAAPTNGGPYPGIVLIHSINGLEEGYRTMTDNFAAQGFVVAAIDWQTFERQPPDDVVRQLTEDTIQYMTAEGNVDPDRLGLTGFCAGGRYTMLLLPQIKQFKAGVAWYGFPYQGQTQPASLIPQLSAPMLIIHGSADQASPVANIYKYADELKTAGKDYELKIYDGEPHGFMVQNGQLRTDAVGMDAFMRMVNYFKQKLG